MTIFSLKFVVWIIQSIIDEKIGASDLTLSKMKEGQIVTKNDDIEKVEGYDTHRLYNIEEFIFDDPIKELVIKLVTRYRDEFKPRFIKESSTMDNGVWLQAIPLLEELKNYYNNYICISTATTKLLPQFRENFE